MKTTTNFLIILFSVLLVVSSCSENNEILHDNPNTSIILGPQQRITFEDIISHYISTGVDSSDLVGWMHLNNTKSNTIQYGTGVFYGEVENTYGDIALYDSNNTNQYPLGITSVNGEVLSKVPENFYFYILFGDVDDGTGLQIGFGSNQQNSIEIASNSYFNGIDTLLYFNEKINFTNISSGDTISKSIGLPLVWNTSATDFVHIALITPPFNTNTGEIGGAFYLNNNGSYSISGSKLSNLKNGLYNLEISSIEPKFLISSTGKYIVLLTQSINEISIYLKD